jgi:prepilin-type N-terminal cleavage/methylation domain-containing protein
MKRTRRNGFTLIEVLAVVFLTAILFGAAVNYYVELSTRSNQAAETTRQWRHATALLDRVAADLERAYLVRKPEERDPLDHPWLFLAETRYAEEGADRIKFTSRRRVDLSTDGPRSDLAFVSYMLRTSEGWEDEDDAQYELLRWSQPGLPTELDRDFPHPDDSQLVADGIAAFQLRFQDDQGTWHEGWDSSQLQFSGALPRTAEIEVAFAAPEAREDALVPALRRRVTFPLPAIDLETLADPVAYNGSGADGEAGESDEDDDLMASECVDRQARDDEGRSIRDVIPGSAENAQQIADRLDEIPWATAKQFIGDLDHPGILCD